MSNILTLDKNKWGPLAWHMIHNYSLKSNDNECMFTLIHTFGYILPCPTCKKHYNYLINDIYKLNKENCNKKILINYLVDVHNIINENLDKKLKISYKKSEEINQKTNNAKFIFFIIIIYSNLNYKKMSFFEFDKIYNFFVCFLKNYPSNKIKNDFKNILESKSFKESDTPLTFKKWFFNNFKKIDFINDYYLKYNKIIINNI